MQPAPAGSLLVFLQRIPDPRGRQGRRHCLEAMLASIVSVLACGMRGYSGITDWIHSQPKEFWYWLGTQRPGGHQCDEKDETAYISDHIHHFTLTSLWAVRDSFECRTTG
ncbi:MAG: transposase family protein [Planctomycetaceae bacterium]|nr:transposase family protein [Planctomycetales bacterium]MCB9926975.1 transposase family protein [Planctomycetaceae bacterium]